MSLETPSVPPQAAPPAPPRVPPSSPVGQALEIFNNSSKTPLPAALASLSVASLWSSAARIPRFKPNRPSIATFAGAFGLGGFIIFDGDLVNGAGFTSAWSILYLMVNGRTAIRQMRAVPLVASGLAAFNAVNYGREFFFPQGPQRLDL